MIVDPALRPVGLLASEARRRLYLTGWRLVDGQWVAPADQVAVRQRP